jgi:hypothetical protein
MDIVEEILNMLKSAPRLGAENDIPEGTRYIQISETLVNKIISDIQEYLDERWSDSIDAMGDDA